MRLPGPLARFAQAPAGAGRRGPYRTGEVGSEVDEATGSTRTTTNGGWDYLLSDREVNPDLVGRARYRALDEMNMTDPVVSGSLMSMKLPMGGAAWGVKAAGKGTDPTDKLVAHAVERQFGLGESVGYDSWLAGGWDALMWQSLLHLDYGSMTQEIVWGPKVVKWSDADGDEHNMLVIERMGPRYPHTLDQYEPGTTPGTPLGSVRQDFIRAAIPGDKLVHLVHQPHLARFTGSSALRPAYGMWKLKRKMIVAAAVGYDRHAAGTPVVRSPGHGTDEEEAQARKMGRGYRTHESAYFWLPGKAPSPGEAGWDVTILNGSGTLADPIPQLKHYDEQIVSAVLGRFFMLGSTDTGSRAVGEVLSEPYYMALNWHAARMARELTQQLVAKFVLVNFGPDVDVPRITVETIQQKNLPLRGDFIAKAKMAGVWFGDLEAMNTIRGWVDVAPLPDDFMVPPPGEGTGPLTSPPPANVQPAPPANDPLNVAASPPPVAAAPAKP